MKSFAKLSLLTLLCFTAVESVVLQQAKAGSTPAAVTTPGSSAIGIDFAPPASSDGGTAVNAGAAGSTEITPELISSNPTLVAAIANAVIAQANALTAGSSPASPIPGQTVPALSPVAASTVRAVFTATTPEAAAAAAAELATQISAEANVSADTATALSEAAEAIAGLALSPVNLPEAIAAINALLNSASRAELEALAKSPSFMAVRQVVVETQTVF